VRRLRTALIVASTLVLVLTGTAWGFYHNISTGITTSDVIVGDGDRGSLDILLVGVDSRVDAQGKPLPPEVQRQLHSGADTGVLNSDTIILLRVPEDGRRAVAFSIPRDSYVEIPGYRQDKISSAYPATKALAAEKLVASGMRDPARVEAESAQQGRSALIQTVEDLTGVRVDHYAEINLLGFYNLTTAIGGVDVCLKEPVNDELSGAKFDAGVQSIAGADALAFVRQRHGLPEGDLSRIRRQQVFLAAVAHKILSSGTLTTPSTLNALIDVVQSSLVIDQGWDVLGFARQASALAAGDVEFMTIPTRGLESTARGEVVIVDRADARGFVEQRIQDQQASAEREVTDRGGATLVPPPPPLPDAERYVVDVRNASGTTGLAAQVAGELREAGFTRGRVENAEAKPTSVILAGPQANDAADSVAAQLGGLRVEAGVDVPPGHVSVVLGADFAPAPTTALAIPTAPAPGDVTITAAGIPCVD